MSEVCWTDCHSVHLTASLSYCSLSPLITSRHAAPDHTDDRRMSPRITDSWVDVAGRRYCLFSQSPSYMQAVFGLIRSTSLYCLRRALTFTRILCSSVLPVSVSELYSSGIPPSCVHLVLMLCIKGRFICIRLVQFRNRPWSPSCHSPLVFSLSPLLQSSVFA